MGIKIEKTVSYIPANKVKNEDLEKMIDTSDEWIYTRSGIKTRFWEEEYTLEEMAKKCVEKFGEKEIEGVDAIIVTSMSNKCLAPSLSAKIASYLNIEDVLSVDLNAACSGYVYGLIVANAYIESNMYNKVLIVSAEKMTNILDKQDRKTLILFGDGVGASLVSKDDKSGILSYYTKTLKADQELYVDENNHLQMLGQDVFKFAYKAIGDCIDNTLSENNINIEDIDYFIFHQANIRIINKIIKKYELDESRVLVNIEEYANTSSASIPLVLAQNDIESGKIVFMCGFGAGLSYGSILYRN